MSRLKGRHPARPMAPLLPPTAHLPCQVAGLGCPANHVTQRFSSYRAPNQLPFTPDTWMRACDQDPHCPSHTLPRAPAFLRWARGTGGACAFQLEPRSQPPRNLSTGPPEGPRHGPRHLSRQGAQLALHHRLASWLSHSRWEGCPNLKKGKSQMSTG